MDIALEETAYLVDTDSKHEKHVAKAANFRDVSEACEVCLKQGQIFRSSEVYGCDVLKEFKIKTILDLRKVSKCMRKKDRHDHPEYPTECHPCSSQYISSGFNAPIVYHVDLIPKHVGLIIMAKMPVKIWWKVAKGACKREDPAKIMCPAVADPRWMGFKQLYITLLDKSQDNIARAVRLFVDHRNFPILVHCIHGKDRTGILIMLILLLCGVPVEAILQDYTQSEACLKESKARNELHMAEYLQADAVMEAHRSSLQAALDHIERKYGGVANYLVDAGITDDELKSIRTNLLQKSVSSADRRKCS